VGSVSNEEHLDGGFQEHKQDAEPFILSVEQNICHRSSCGY